MNKLLVLNGYPSGEETIETEVIDLANPSTSCNPLGSLPSNIAAGAGGLLVGQHPIACSGFDGSDYISACFIPPGSSGLWTEIAHLQVERRDSASIMVDNRTLWITGGYNSQDKRLDSTELVTLVDSEMVNVKLGPNLPIKVRDHCLAKLNSTHAILIGGNTEDSDYSRSTFILPLGMEAGGASSGPELLSGRKDHACGIISNQAGHFAIVAGGYDGNYLSSTEIWQVDQDNWTPGPVLDYKMVDSVGLSTWDGLSFLLIGGVDQQATFYRTIFKLEQIHQEWIWTRLVQELKTGRSDHTAMLIPDSLANCTATVKVS